VHIKLCEELFSAARSEFKHMDFFYFHNCLYGISVEGQSPRTPEKISLGRAAQISHDYKDRFVGDATMSPYEVTCRRQRRALERRGGRGRLDRVAQIYRTLMVAEPSDSDRRPTIPLHALGYGTSKGVDDFVVFGEAEDGERKHCSK